MRGILTRDRVLGGVLGEHTVLCTEVIVNERDYACALSAATLSERE